MKTKTAINIVTGVVWFAIMLLFSILVSIQLTDILIEPLREAVAIEQIKTQAGAKRAKINKLLSEMEQRPPIWLIRKFWHADRARLWLHFIGEATKIGGESE